MKKIQEAQQRIIPDGIDGFGRRLANARKTAGYTTIDELATQMRHQKSTVSRWEAGKNRPDYETLIELSELLNVTIDYLLTGTSSENVDASRRYGLSNNSLNMLEELNQINYMTPHWYSGTIQTHPIRLINAFLESQTFRNIIDMLLEVHYYSAYSAYIHPQPSVGTTHLVFDYEGVALRGKTVLPTEEVRKYKIKLIQEALTQFTYELTNIKLVEQCDVEKLVNRALYEFDKSINIKEDVDSEES